MDDSGERVQRDEGDVGGKRWPVAVDRVLYGTEVEGAVGIGAEKYHVWGEAREAARQTSGRHGLDTCGGLSRRVGKSVSLAVWCWLEVGCHWGWKS